MFFNVIGQVLVFLGSLCLLLFGMNMLSNGIQKGAGSGLQKLLAKIAGNRFKSVLTGIGVTAIIQSSGATTVMVVSFVNASILTLEQAIGVIFGANIGTTVTAWIVKFFGFSFSMSAAALPIFALGFVLKYLKKFKIHNFSNCFMGFALLFMALDLLKKSLSLGEGPAQVFMRISSWGAPGILLGVLMGAIFTALIHSSSAMTAIVLAMAANGTLSWELSAAIVLGSNIGSTIDAVMSAFNASSNARRTALVHVSFNVIGSVIALLCFRPFLSLVDLIVPASPKDDITTHIAMLHTAFNVCATLIFIPFVRQIADLSRKIIKDGERDEAHYKLPAILPYTHASADVYSFQVQSELSKMASRVMDMFDSICNTLVNRKNADSQSEKVDFLENYIDEMKEEITAFLEKCSRLPSANKDDRNNFSRLIHISDSLENLSDECCSMMHTLQKFVETDFKKSEKRAKEIADYIELVRVFFEHSCLFFTLGLTRQGRLKSEDLEQEIDEKKKELKKASRKRLENGGDVKAELQYIDMVRKIERAGDCVYAMVQSM